MIDAKLQDELRIRFNPDGSELRRYQLYLLEMLKDFDVICRKHNIRYWLSSGTCLGAVRHGGFIPWDDDLDVEMLKPDYDKLLKVFRENENYVLQTSESDPYYALPFAKFRDKRTHISEVSGLSRFASFSGAFIDVFPIERSSKIMSYVSAYLTLPMLYFWSDHVIPRFKIYPTWLRTLFKIQKVANQTVIGMCRILNGIYPSEALRHSFGSPFFKNRRWQEDFFPLRYVKFEDASFPVPCNYSHYLSAMYGDYEKIPSINTIQAPHVCEISYETNEI